MSSLNLITYNLDFVKLSRILLSRESAIQQKETLMTQLPSGHLPKGFSSTDFALIQELQEKGVLVSMRGEELRADAGTVPVLCSDGDRMLHLFTHLTDTCTTANFPVRPHLIAYPGAPILLSRHSPEILGMRIDRLFIHGIKTGPDMKNIQTVIIVPHWPCGMAKACNISLTRSLELAMNGKARVRRELPSLREVVACLHVDYGNGTMNVYHINHKKWLRYITDVKHGTAYPESLYLASMPL